MLKTETYLKKMREYSIEYLLEYHTSATCQKLSKKKITQILLQLCVSWNKDFVGRQLYAEVCDQYLARNVSIAPWAYTYTQAQNLMEIQNPDHDQKLIKSFEDHAQATFR